MLTNVNTRTRRLPLDCAAPLTEDALSLAAIAQLERAISQVCRRQRGGLGLFRRTVREMALDLAAGGSTLERATRFFETVLRQHPDFWQLDDHRSVGRASPRDSVMNELAAVLDQCEF